MDNTYDLAQKRTQWKQSLGSALLEPVTLLNAVEYTKGWRTKSEPVLLECEDSHDYVVKGQQAGRQIVNDQLVARLGELLEAPVGKPAIIFIPQELIALEPNLQTFVPGTAHGTLWIPDCRDEYTLIATSEKQNRLRLVLLATLYGWTYANDHQFLFKRNPPRLIYSVDHGHFFLKGPNWSIDNLLKTPSARLDPYFSECGFSKDELGYAYQKLMTITEEQLIHVISVIPNEWDFTIEERVTMIEYLTRRQQQLSHQIKALL